MLSPEGWAGLTVGSRVSAVTAPMWIGWFLVRNRPRGLHRRRKSKPLLEIGAFLPPLPTEVSVLKNDFSRRPSLCHN